MQPRRPQGQRRRRARPPCGRSRRRRRGRARLAVEHDPAADAGAPEDAQQRASGWPAPSWTSASWRPDVVAEQAGAPSASLSSAPPSGNAPSQPGRLRAPRDGAGRARRRRPASRRRRRELVARCPPPGGLRIVAARVSDVLRAARRRRVARLAEDGVLLVDDDGLHLRPAQIHACPDGHDGHCARSARARPRARALPRPPRGHRTAQPRLPGMVRARQEDLRDVPRRPPRRRPPALWCAAPEGMQEALIAGEGDHYFRPPYVGHRGWIGVHLNRGLDWNEIAGAIEDAYAEVAPKPSSRRLARCRGALEHHDGDAGRSVSWYRRSRARSRPSAPRGRGAPRPSRRAGGTGRPRLDLDLGLGLAHRSMYQSGCSGRRPWRRRSSGCPPAMP